MNEFGRKFLTMLVQIELMRHDKSEIVAKFGAILTNPDSTDADICYAAMGLKVLGGKMLTDEDVTELVRRRAG